MGGGSGDGGGEGMKERRLKPEARGTLCTHRGAERDTSEATPAIRCASYVWYPMPSSSGNAASMEA